MAWTTLRISESIGRRCKVDGGVWWFGTACQLSAVLLLRAQWNVSEKGIHTYTGSAARPML